MATKRKRIIGGYRFARFAGRPEQELVEGDLPARVTILLSAAGGPPLRSLVEQGQRVEAGQLLARDDESVGSPVPATISGTIEEIHARVITIAGNGSKDWRTLEGCSPEWNNLERRAVETLLYLSGACALADGGLPTRFNSAAVGPEEVEQIILQMIPDEVFSPSPEVLLQGNGPAEVAEGLAILARIMPQAALHLAGDRNQRPFLEQVRRAAGRFGPSAVALHIVPAKYPVHRSEVLVPALLGKELPYGHSPVNVGVVVVDLQALLQMREAVVAGKPVIDRIVALAGSGFSRRPHLRLRIGAPVDGTLQRYLENGRTVRVVRNSLLTGHTLFTHPSGEDKTPAATGLLDPGMSALIAVPEGGGGPLLPFARPGFRTDSYSRTFLANFLPFSKSIDTNLHGERRPCISCAYCNNVCPVGLFPHLLHRYVERGIIDESLVRYRIFDCIECNLCTYLCTSKIPLAQLMREGKEQLRAEGLDPTALRAAELGLKGITEPGGEPEEEQA